jgi:hypothetical protein
VRVFIFLTLLLSCAWSSAAQVVITESEYEGATHFVIRTKLATYWYDRAGGGFSRMIDRDGRDWISFKREPWGKVPESAASAFRGIPNFVHGASADAGAGHPGFTKCESRLVGKNQITTTSKSGTWQWTWTFFDDRALVTMEKADAQAGYWFLYEGTPGGSYSPATWYWGNDAKGARLDKPDFLKSGRDISPLRWAYFGDDKINRVLFIAHHQRDEIADMFGVMGATKAGIDSPDGMTVFGFGRARESKTLMTAAPNTFTLGFYEKKIANEPQHAEFAKFIGKLLPKTNAQTSSSQINIWYGNEQRFGASGVPQRWINVLGNVTNAAQLASLTYTLNGGAAQKLSMGKNDTRLAMAGDFNIELDQRELLAGANKIIITATNKAGRQISETVIAHFTPNRFAQLPLEVDWRKVKTISDAAQIVDGLWRLEGDGVRTMQPYYDRVLAFGDMNWRDYEATVEVTFHSFAEPKPQPPTYGVSHAGIGLRWQGHQEDGQQPRVQWFPLGAATEFQLFNDLSQSHWRILHGGGRTMKRTNSTQRTTIQLGKKYFLKGRVESVAGGQTLYRNKIWAADESEPDEWAVESLESADDFQHGGLLLVAHNTDVTFGKLKVTAPPPLPPSPLLTAFNEPNSKARLGEMHYSALAGGTVGAKGKKFACELVGEKGRVLSVQVAVSNDKLRLIKALRFEMTNTQNQRITETCGNESNAEWLPIFMIPDGRQIVGISGASGWYVDNLRFHLDDGTMSPIYGGKGGDTEFRLLLHQSGGKWKGHLRGFWGLSENAIEALGLIFWPIE